MRPKHLLLGLALVLAGCSAGSTAADGSPPLVAITAPADGATVNGQVSIDVTAIDDFGVDKVRIYVDNNLLTELYTPPFHAVWNTSDPSILDNSVHTIKAEALDVARNFQTQQIAVTVSKGHN